MRRRPDGVTLIAIYEFVTAAMLLAAGCVILPIVLVLAPFSTNDAGDFFGVVFAISASIVLLFGIGAASLVVGVGLLRMRSWARFGALALAVPVLIGAPIWTVLGLLIIWYLGFGPGKDAFDEDSRGVDLIRPATVSPPAETTTESEARATVTSEPAVTVRPDDVTLVEPTDEPGRLSPAEPAAESATVEMREPLIVFEPPHDRPVEPEPSMSPEEPRLGQAEDERRSDREAPPPRGG